MNGSVRCQGDGVAGVVCSDGRSVVRTGGDGSFVITPAGPFVFVCVPTGYACTRWYLSSDGPLEFELVPDEQSVPFSFAHVTDLHLSLDEWVFGDPVAATPEATAAVFDEVVARAPLAFIAVTGDQTNNGTDGEFAAYREIVARVRLRTVAIPGNHDHNSVDTAAARAKGERFGPGVAVTPYDEHLGPRWFSFDHAGVHFVAIDWTTHHLGLERDVQEAWVGADLAEVADGAPVIFLTHDLMSSDFLRRDRVNVVGSFSGHWHTSRVVEDNGALHVNTAPATFGGLDYAAAQWRVATWDGQRLSVETIRRNDPLFTRAAIATAEWTASAGASSLRAGPLLAGDLVVVATGDEDHSAGSLAAYDARTGKPRWSVPMRSAVKSSPIVAGDRVVATAVTGETVCVALSSGEELWRREIDDRLRLWTYLRPCTDGERIFVGDTARFCALDLADGSVVWSRDDLGVRGNITCHASPVVADGVLVVSFAAQVPDMWGLDPRTGATIWPPDAHADNAYDLGEQTQSSLARSPVSAFAADPDGSDVYVIRLANTLDRVRAADGSVVWSSRVAGFFSPAAPVATGDDVVISEGTGAVRCVSRADGSTRWTTTVAASSPVWMGPYRNSGGALLGDALVTDLGVIVLSSDGRVVTLSRDDGSVMCERAIGRGFASAPALGPDNLMYSLDIDGTLRATDVSF